jgi:hypothetical protein
MRKINPSSQKFSLEEVLGNHESWKSLSDNEAFSNDHKPHRERWCVAILCKKLGINDCEISTGTEPADVYLVTNGRQSQIQVVECRNEGPRDNPSDLNCNTQEDGIVLVEYVGYPNLNDPIKEIIQKKENKNYAGADQLILLIYLNRWFTDINCERQFKLTELKTISVGTRFKAIIVYDGKDGLVFIKGDEKVFNQGQ